MDATVAPLPYPGRFLLLLYQAANQEKQGVEKVP
jgi:hypothetical protein